MKIDSRDITLTALFAALYVVITSFTVIFFNKKIITLIIIFRIILTNRVKKFCFMKLNREKNLFIY
jgi:uncharacterized membrane protein